MSCLQRRVISSKTSMFGVVAVAAPVAEDHHRGPPGHQVRELLAESSERGAVVGIGVDVQHVAAEDLLQRALHRMLGEQVGDLTVSATNRQTDTY